MILLYAVNLSDRNALVIYASRLIMHGTLGELIYDSYREPIVRSATIITAVTTPLQ